MRSLLNLLLAFNLGLTWLSPGAFAITRVGGGSLQSVDQGYELKIPLRFDNIYLFADDKARFQENMIISRVKQTQIPSGGMGGIGSIGGGLFPSSIDLRIFSEEYPEYVALSAFALIEKLTINGWTRLANSNPCVVSFAMESNTASFALASWGEGKGIVLVGDKSEEVRTAIQEMLLSLSLLEGACQWK